MEDLKSSAGRAYRLALQLCGPCRDYHAVWPYLRLAGAIGGPQADGATLVRLLQERSATTPIERLALAGSADAGLLALVDRALGTSSARVVVTVVDRCPTPLTLCREYSGSEAISVVTIEDDLLHAQPPEPQDVVVAHSVLSFLPVDRQSVLLSRLRDWLRPGGVLLLSSRGQPDYGTLPLSEIAARRAEGVLAALASTGVALPEDEAEFRQRLTRNFAMGLLERDACVLDPVGLAAAAEASGFSVATILKVAGGTSSPFRPHPLPPRTIVVAERPGGAA